MRNEWWSGWFEGLWVGLVVGPVVLLLIIDLAGHLHVYDRIMCIW